MERGYNGAELVAKGLVMVDAGKREEAAEEEQRMGKGWGEAREQVGPDKKQDRLERD